MTLINFDSIDYRRFLDELPHSVVAADHSGKIVAVNSNTLLKFGYTLEELIGKNVRILMPSPERENHDRYLENYLRTKERKIIGVGRRVIAKRKDGSLFPIFLTVCTQTTESGTYFIALVREMIEEDRLNSWLNGLLSSVQAVLCFVDSDLKIRFINRSLTGQVDVKQFVGKSLSELLEPHNVLTIQSSVREALTSGRAQGCTVQHKGRVVDLTISAVSSIDNPGGAVIAGHDITALSNHARELQEKAIEVERLSHQRQMLLREVYHRVKNNAQVISSLLSLQMDIEPDPGLKSALEQVRSRVLALNSVNDMIYSENSLTEIDLGVYLNRIAHSFASSHISLPLQHQVEAVVDEGCLVVPDQAVSCGAILNELLINSVKYADIPNGPLRSHFTIWKNSDELCFAYSDNGDFFKNSPEWFGTGGNLGSRIVRGFASNLNAKLTFPTYEEWIRNHGGDEVSKKIPNEFSSRYCIAICFPRRTA